MGWGGGLCGVGYLGLGRELLAIDSVLLLQLLHLPSMEAGKAEVAAAVAAADEEKGDKGLLDSYGHVIGPTLL